MTAARVLRIAHRLCLDYPERVTCAVLLDIIPTLTLYETVNQEVATVYFHWFFLIQKAPLPENLIGGDPIQYLHWALGAGRAHWWCRGTTPRGVGGL